MKHFLQLFGVFLLLTSLTACPTLGPTTTADTVYQLRLAYDTVFLAPAAMYNQLPHCTDPVTIVVCSKQTVVDQLRKADDAAKAFLDGAEDVVRNHPELDASLAIAAAKNAVEAAKTIMIVYKIGG